MITLLLFSILAFSLGCLVFKLTAKMFALGLRLVLFGVTAGVIFVPMLFGMVIF